MNKKSILKTLLTGKVLLAIMAASIIFNGCMKETENVPQGPWPYSPFNGTIKAKVVDGVDYNDLISNVVVLSKTVNGEEEEIASSAYSDGGFTINLPTKPNTKFLFQITEIFGDESSIIYSDNDAEVCVVNVFEAYDIDDVYAGYLYFGKYSVENHVIDAFFVYADRNLTVTGSTDDCQFTVTLLAGWNRVLNVEHDGSQYMTSQESVGIRCYFEAASDDDTGEETEETEETEEPEESEE
jgi:hypothetical protein